MPLEVKVSPTVWSRIGITSTLGSNLFISLSPHLIWSHQMHGNLLHRWSRLCHYSCIHHCSSLTSITHKHPSSLYKPSFHSMCFSHHPSISCHTQPHTSHNRSHYLLHHSSTGLLPFSPYVQITSTQPVLLDQPTLITCSPINFIPHRVHTRYSTHTAQTPHSIIFNLCNLINYG